MTKSRFFSIFLSLFVIILIIFSGPTYGINIVINGLSVHYKNDIPPFSITATLQEGELIPINYVNLTITFPNSTKTTCKIFPNGTIQNCNFILFESISFSGSYSYGYGYGYENQTIYSLGYGYGYTGPGYINISLKLNTSYIPGGNYQIKAEIFAGYEQTHLFSSTTSSFTILEFPWLSTVTTTVTTTMPTTSTVQTTTATTTTTIIPTTTTTALTSTTASTTTQTTTTIPTTSTVQITTTVTTKITTTQTSTITSTMTPTTSTTLLTTTSLSTTSIITTMIPTTTTIPSSTTTMVTTTTQPTTTTTNICSGKPLTTCLLLSSCEWVGDTRLGYCRQKIVQTTLTTTQPSGITTTSTVTTTLPTTSTIPSICDGKGFINCILMSQCKWIGNTKTGRCILSEIYITTTSTITEIPTTTTIFIPSDCQQKNFLLCLLSSECKWLGDLRLGYCIEK